MEIKSELMLNCLAIGSLPHKDVESAMNLVKENFNQIPFWPQLAKFNKNEDMIVQFLEHLPGIVFDKDAEKVYVDNESEDFFVQLESLFLEYEEIISNPKSELLEKYQISQKFSSTVNPFFEIVKELKPAYAKGQIIGPFTLATSLTDKDGKCAFYDETVREVIVKTLSLKALWQIEKIKKANADTTPIIFLDEPSLSQLGTSAFITISRNEALDILKEVSQLIQANGALCAIHCCGKCDWSILVEAGIDIINFDGYFFAQNLSLYSEDLRTFIENGGKIAWGLVPTLDKDALEKIDINVLLEKFDEAIEYLVVKGIDKSMLIQNSMISPSCGAGSLSIELAEKAMCLTKELSLKLREKFIK